MVSRSADWRGEIDSKIEVLIESAPKRLDLGARTHWTSEVRECVSFLG